MRQLKLGVLGSGRGSNFVALQQAIERGACPAEIVLVLSDQPEAPILQRAAEFGIRAACLPTGPFRTRLDPEHEQVWIAELQKAGAELVVLAGFMRVVKSTMLAAFPGRILNIHPSLLPKFPGLEAWKQALAAGETVTGCTVHYVDHGIDTGEIIAQREVPISPGDTAETLHARIQAAEHELYPAVIAAWAERR